MSWLEFELAILRMRGKRSNRLHHRRATSFKINTKHTKYLKYWVNIVIYYQWVDEIMVGPNHRNGNNSRLNSNNIHNMYIDEGIPKSLQFEEQTPIKHVYEKLHMMKL